MHLPACKGKQMSYENDKMAAKSQLRKEMSKVLAGLSEPDKQKQSQLVLQRLVNHPKYRQAHRVSIFLSTNNEINTTGILRQALEVDKKRCFVPLVLKGAAKSMDTRMVMYELKSMVEYEQLPLNHYGIKEPRQFDSGRFASSLDLVVVPGVAFDLAGRRLGHGKGYYDEFLAHWAGLYSIGVAFREQIVPVGELPFIEGNDACLDEVLVAP